MAFPDGKFNIFKVLDSLNREIWSYPNFYYYSHPFLFCWWSSLAERYRNRGKRLGLRFNLIAGIYNLEPSKKW